MRVLYFGTYERDYPRNAQVISSLRKAGVDVVETHVPVWEGSRDKLSLGFRSAGRLVAAQLRLARSTAAAADVLIVGYPGHADMIAARHVARGRPVVFNPLVSLVDTMVGDRQLLRHWSPKATALRLVDATAFRRADLVVADTAAHARYFARRLGLPDGRLASCFVGAEDRLFQPGPRDTHATEVLFVGTLIPLHGLETILAAAALCPDIPFRIVGSGQREDVLSSRPPNVTWEPWVAYERLPELYRSACCALGIFGVSDKAARVIPNKVFQALATSTPVITADTTAARELLVDGHDALLVPAGAPDALAVAIRRLAADSSLRDQLSERGRETYTAHASEEVLGSRWRDLLERLVEA